MQIGNYLRGLLGYSKAQYAIKLAEVFKDWQRPAASCDLPEDQLRYIHDASKCPYCKSKYGLYEGPRGGASINLFCGNPDCDSRFNVVDPSFGFVGIGQFTGRCPEDFIEHRRKEIADGMV
ncbi:hypothetical protein [Mesorhizobium sp. M8A.F.Ca.ET.021.01.1.1]|uniref:hypothetical protein n=1 Tax=Mesorhizobium sp. M8A.F.Ca.ET.021.01.1.1 TaxID=2496757 RepID=UPI000FCA56D4|nr:hypothetical protein [Mesorhizobium sp. M8A.F.Ca.ET.021.01.1.1]RUW56833.1 hypothetical protein EOA36_02215 [Mesorhizobium sp. M8A.F.Ca.ET.021.01.1.1]